MGNYIHESSEWPKFRWDDRSVALQVAQVRHRQGKLIGLMDALGFERCAQANLTTLTEDVIKSSEIEGEILDRQQVRSSLARRLGLDIGALLPVDRNAEGVVEMMLDATQNYADPLTVDRICRWHASLFPTGQSGLVKIVTGAWRTSSSGAMQVVSGSYGKEKVHFKAPDSERLAREMPQFLEWFQTEQSVDPVIKAALAHLWFVTIHPFEDGNGRIARAIADLALARSEKSPLRFYSVSSQICGDRKEYYERLEATQKGNLDVTKWIEFFLVSLDHAIARTEDNLSLVLRKARFWESAKGHSINERQKNIINLLLDGFQGNLTTSKWATLTKTSQDTANRDITELVKFGLLVRNNAGGRSTSYSLLF